MEPTQPLAQLRQELDRRLTVRMSTTRLDRKYPCPGELSVFRIDSDAFTLAAGESKSLTTEQFTVLAHHPLSLPHGPQLSFEDGDICELLDAKEHPCILQRGDGSDMAVAAMLARDYGKKFDDNLLYSGIPWSFDYLITIYEKMGLHVAICQIHASELNNETQFPLVVWTRFGQIIIDALDETTATIRDPYHGWVVRVTKQSLLDACCDSSGQIEALLVISVDATVESSVQIQTLECAVSDSPRESAFLSHLTKV